MTPETKKLIEALKPFIQHKSSCNSLRYIKSPSDAYGLLPKSFTRKVTFSDYKKSYEVESKRCTCGLNEAITEAEKADTKASEQTMADMRIHAEQHKIIYGHYPDSWAPTNNKQGREWIAANTLPDQHEKVLVKIGDEGTVFTAIMDGDDRWNIYYSDGINYEDPDRPVTHWMKIPK